MPRQTIQGGSRHSVRDATGPSTVDLSWSATGLHFLARLADLDVGTRARGPGERLWELGDVLEIFAGSPGAEAYLELHVAPNGCTLQLGWPSVSILTAMRARNERDLGAFVRTEPLFRAEPRLVPDGWEVEGVVFAQALESLNPAGCGHGTRWALSFSRYDYGAEAVAPLLSSTSPHPVADFHRRSDWRTVVLG